MEGMFADCSFRKGLLGLGKSSLSVFRFGEKKSQIVERVPAGVNRSGKVRVS